MRDFIHDLVRDSIRQALLATRPVAAFPMSRARGVTPADTDTAEVSEKLSEEVSAESLPALARRLLLPRGRSVCPRGDPSRGRGGFHSKPRCPLTLLPRP